LRGALQHAQERGDIPHVLSCPTTTSDCEKSCWQNLAKSTFASIDIALLTKETTQSAKNNQRITAASLHPRWSRVSSLAHAQFAAQPALLFALCASGLDQTGMPAEPDLIAEAAVIAGCS
tara:strand:+ start:147 stop:506 length:360 start_codon:yes stop_codon:yes gene_type:complete